MSKSIENIQFSKPLKLTLFLAKIVGIVPFSLRNVFQKKVVQVILKLIRIFYLCGFFVICWMHFIYFRCSKNRYNSMSAKISNILSNGYNILMCFLCYIITIFYDKKYKIMFNIFYSFDNNLKNKNRKHLENIFTYENLIFVLNIIFIITIFYIQLCYNFKKFPKNYFCMVFTFLSICISAVILLLNVLLLLEVRKRFQLLNRFLKSLIVFSYHRMTSEKYTNITKQIEKCSKLYHIIFILTKLIKQIFEIFITIKFLLSFCLVILLLFYLSADNDTFNERFPTRIDLYILIFWTFLLFTKIFTITYAFKLVTTEVSIFFSL